MVFAVRLAIGQSPASTAGTHTEFL